MFDTKEIDTIDALLAEAKSSNIKYDLMIIQKAYDLAAQICGNGQRRSGGSVRTHFLTVAVYMIRLHLDTTSVVAALLHESLEKNDKKDRNRY
jgi:(p)ppGpp synthase/HD superfamily hydrolase